MKRDFDKDVLEIIAKAVRQVTDDAETEWQAYLPEAHSVLLALDKANYEVRPLHRVKFAKKMIERRLKEPTP